MGLEFTYYNRSIENLLLDRALPASSGFTTEIISLSELVNTGYEVGLNALVVNKLNFRINTSLRFWLNRSEVTHLGVPSFEEPSAGFGLGLGNFYIQEGKPITQINSVNPETGNIERIGDAEPDYQSSLFTEINFLRNFDFSFLLHLRQGVDNLNLRRALTDFGSTSPDFDEASGKQRLEQLGKFGPIGINYIEDASYFRIREASIYYNIRGRNASALTRTIQNIRVGFSARNFLTVTNYSSYDPEVSLSGSSGLASGLETGAFPSSSQYYLHFNIQF